MTQEADLAREHRQLGAPFDEEASKPTKLSDLADLLMSWKLAKENAEEELKKANGKIREVEAVILARMQEDEIERFGHAGQLFFPRVESHPSVNKEKEGEFFEWLKENNEDGILKLTVHPMTLKAWWKQNSERFAEEITEKDLLRVHEDVRVGMRKAS